VDEALARRGLGVFALWPHGADVANTVPNLFPIRPRFRRGSGAQGLGKAFGFRALTSTPIDWIYGIASESLLNQAYAWLCERRRDYSPAMTFGMCAGDGRNSARSFRIGCVPAPVGSVRCGDSRPATRRSRLVGLRCAGAESNGPRLDRRLAAKSLAPVVPPGRAGVELNLSAVRWRVLRRLASA
jgi:hypothetical protein